MAILKSELSKCAERVEDCHRYKAFLDSITPVEFFDDKQRKLQKRRDAIMAQWQVRRARLQSEACFENNTRVFRAIALRLVAGAARVRGPVRLPMHNTCSVMPDDDSTCSMPINHGNQL